MCIIYINYTLIVTNTQKFKYFCTLSFRKTLYVWATLFEHNKPRTIYTSGKMLKIKPEEGPYKTRKVGGETVQIG